MLSTLEGEAAAGFSRDLTQLPAGRIRLSSGQGAPRETRTVLTPPSMGTVRLVVELRLLLVGREVEVLEEPPREEQARRGKGTRARIMMECPQVRVVGAAPDRSDL